jgi:8-oxo-dGTP diphosphatase
MTDWQVQAHPQEPPIIDAEVERLAARYGAPERRFFTLPADEAALVWRFGGQGDRRAEVVFAVQDPSGGVWVHAKSHYPRKVYRLPSGGIHWHEDVEGALLRELDEEIGIPVRVLRFLGLIEYQFLHDGMAAPFASYVFLVESPGGAPQPHATEGITSFQLVPPGHLTQIAAELRNLMGDRREWGQWRALVHDLVYGALAAPGELGL